MKRILFFSLVLTGLFAISCEKEKVGGTVVESLSGEWYITIDAVDAKGNVMTDVDGSSDYYTDYFGTGRQVLLTYNTAADSPFEMYLDMSLLEDIDCFPFLGFKVLIPCSTLFNTFGTDSDVPNKIIYDVDYSSADTVVVSPDTVIVPSAPVVDRIQVWNGRVIIGGAVAPSGTRTDAIEFEFRTNGDDIGYSSNQEEKPGNFRTGYSFADRDNFDHYKVTGYRYTGSDDDQ